MIIERLDEDGNPTGEIYNTEDNEDEEPKEEVKLEPSAPWPFDNVKKENE
jgi:hypothetical protein